MSHVTSGLTDFGGKNVIPSSLYYEVLQKCCCVKTSQEHGSSFGIFRSTKSQLPPIRITEQRILLTKRQINRPGYKSF